jgi:pyrroline-5-carboxylate reductase
MSDTKSVVLAGCGNMGYAMLQGWLASGALAKRRVHVVEPADALRERAAGLGVNAVAAADELPDALIPALIILAVKPQVMDDVLPTYADMARLGSTIVSVAAGIRVARMEKILGNDAAIIRVMPNTPAAVGAGMMVLYANGQVSVETLDFAKTLMAASGAVAEIEDEEMMDAVTAVSGSGPAYRVSHDRGIDRGREAGRIAGRYRRAARPADCLRRSGLCAEKRHGARDACASRSQARTARLRPRYLC